jgi:hypothetical protein
MEGGELNFFAWWVGVKYLCELGSLLDLEHSLFPILQKYDIKERADLLVKTKKANGYCLVNCEKPAWSLILKLQILGGGNMLLPNELSWGLFPFASDMLSSNDLPGLATHC